MTFVECRLILPSFFSRKISVLIELLVVFRMVVSASNECLQFHEIYLRNNSTAFIIIVKVESTISFLLKVHIRDFSNLIWNCRIGIFNRINDYHYYSNNKILLIFPELSKLGIPYDTFCKDAAVYFLVK